MTSVVRQLRAWQSLEWGFVAARGFAYWLAIVFCGVAIACLVDWYCDRYRETPGWLRAFLTGSQVVGYSLSAWLIANRIRRPSLDSLASKAEAAIPAFGHRLVTALQLNRTDARTAGMSRQLIDILTQEADTIGQEHKLSLLVDRKPLYWAAGILAPLALIASIMTLVNPTLVLALLQRQLLLPVDIPRSIEVTSATPELLPSGDAIQLLIKVTGSVDEKTVGKMRVTPYGQPSEFYDATFQTRSPDGAAIFAAQLPPSSEPFQFTARVADGRMRRPANVRFESRPVVSGLVAWTILPGYVDHDQKRKKQFEKLQLQGEVSAHSDSQVRVRVDISKPVVDARLTVLGRGPAGEDIILYVRPMTLDSERTSAEHIFPLGRLTAYTLADAESMAWPWYGVARLFRPTAYRVEVADEYGFTNVNPPRRGITLRTDDAPIVTLLDETFNLPVLKQGIKVADQLDGCDAKDMPLLQDGKILVGYKAESPLGIRAAELVYNINGGSWYRLPLAPIPANPDRVGQFIPEIGLFEKQDDFSQVEMYLIPADDPENNPDGLRAGGRLSFQTASLTKPGPDGKPTKLSVGDWVEFYVAVYDRKPNAPTGPARLAGVSIKRTKTVCTREQFEEWLKKREDSRKRLQDVEDAQRGVFGQKSQR